MLHAKEYGRNQPLFWWYRLNSFRPGCLRKRLPTGIQGERVDVENHDAYHLPDMSGAANQDIHRPGVRLLCQRGWGAEAPTRSLKTEIISPATLIFNNTQFSADEPTSFALGTFLICLINPTNLCHKSTRTSTSTQSSIHLP